MKKGFTLIELLVVIMILAVIMIIAVPSVQRTNASARQKTYDTKIKLIKKAAVMYGQDNKKNNTVNLTILDLISKGYLDSDNLDTNCTSKCVQDPRDTSRYLDCDSITLNIDSTTGKVTVQNYTDNSATCYK